MTGPATLGTAARRGAETKTTMRSTYGRGRAKLQKGLVYGAAFLTFAVLLFLIGYILISGIPHLKSSLFALQYTSENVSMLPAMITTVETVSYTHLVTAAKRRQIGEIKSFLAENGADGT